MENTISLDTLEKIITDHYQYLKTQNFLGWDVFDGLNSQLFQALPLKHVPLARLLWIQFFKRSPWNFRHITRVPKADNPKALALFISALLNLYAVTHDKTYLQDIEELVERLIRYANYDYGGMGWGYNFPWQARAFYVPAYKPNMIVSVFTGHAFLDLYEYFKNPQYLDYVKQIALFLKSSLIIFEKKDQICFGYIPGESTIVHNANMLGAGLLSRLYAITQTREYKHLAEKAMRFSVTAQREDGAWVYGAASHHQWIDNFHTGYNLWALYQYQYYTGDDQFEAALQRGFDYHLKHHYTSEFLPKYTDKSLYPLDIHCFSQALITFSILKKYYNADSIQLIDKMLQNVLALMYDDKKHFFYYQKYHRFTIKIPYIRWSQAWMFYALTKVFKEQYDDSSDN